MLVKINEIKNQTSSDVEPIWIVDIRRKYLQSSTSNFWIKSTNPTFALMRPWWLSTISFSLLATQTFEITGVLVPGICPYSNYLEVEDYYNIKQAIFQKLKFEDDEQDRSSTLLIKNNVRNLFNPLTYQVNPMEIYEKK